MTVPIIIIHKGDSFVLRYVIEQAKYFNTDADIILLGDSHNIKYHDIVHHEPVNNYFDDAEKFAKYYKHYGPNNYNFELFCIQRWFVLDEFMKKNKIERCFCMDSDVLLYTNISKDVAYYKKFDFTINNGRVGHCMFVNSVNSLHKFCEYVKNMYIDNSIESIVKLSEEYLKIKGIGGISDMTLLNLYYQKNRKLIGDTFEIVNNTLYDHNINAADGFEMKKNIKKIFFKKNIPYGILQKNGKKVGFKCLHFQGKAKKYIPLYFTKKDFKFYLRTVLIISKVILKKVFA